MTFLGHTGLGCIGGPLPAEPGHRRPVPVRAGDVLHARGGRGGGRSGGSAAVPAGSGQVPPARTDLGVAAGEGWQNGFPIPR